MPSLKIWISDALSRSTAFVKRWFDSVNWGWAVSLFIFALLLYWYPLTTTIVALILFCGLLFFMWATEHSEVDSLKKQLAAKDAVIRSLHEERKESQSWTNFSVLRNQIDTLRRQVSLQASSVDTSAMEPVVLLLSQACQQPNFFHASETAQERTLQVYAEKVQTSVPKDTLVAHAMKVVRAIAPQRAA